MEELVLVGGGGHCKSCIDVIETGKKYRVAGIVDLPGKLGQNLLGYSFFAVDDDLLKLSKQYRNFLVTLGQINITDTRKNLFDTLVRLGVSLPAIISPLAYMSKHAGAGRGTIIMHGAIVNAGAAVGDNCIINTNAHVEHDAHIGDHCHIATGAIINGDVKVGKGCFIGSGAVTKQSCTIPDFTFIKANSLYI